MHDALLIELLTEELPPRSLKSLAGAFGSNLYDYLSGEGLIPVQATEIEVFATPRRIAAIFPNVLDKQEDRPVHKWGPNVAAGIGPDGKPSKALEGFARSCGVPIDRLQRESDGKAERYLYVSMKAGEPLEHLLADLVGKAIKVLPVSKLMRWGDHQTEFVRPVHGLIMLHGQKVIPGEVLGQSSSNRTRGHRFLSAGALTIDRAQDYGAKLEAKGHVIAGFDKRRDQIAVSLEAQAVGHNAIWFGHRNLSAGEALKLLPGERAELSDLLDEVTALVEWPAVYEGSFDKEFLTVPQECLILSMQQHQKYFPLLDKNTGKLRYQFLIVSNLETDDPKNIVKGNERVLRARLSDAKFFYDQDRKTRLADRVERLGNVVYHNKLGSQLERVQRIRKLASSIAEKLGADVEKTERAAWLLKADLLTDMVGEFPELQGTMGRYYALHDSEDSLVARAIEEHYLPRISGDKLPEDNIGCAVALADKLDTLVGIYGIGLVPTGDKDPFGLRRQALGVLRILSEKSLPLDLVELLGLAKLPFAPGVLHDSVAVDLHGFMLERLRSYLRERGFAQDEIEAVVSQNPTRIDQVVPRLEAVQVFRAMPEAESLASANKRIRNILKKTTVTQTVPDSAVLREPAEKDLFAATSRLTPTISSLWESRDYTEALRQLAGVRREVDTFFDQVMVMTDETVIRNNRLALLSQLERLMNQVADISKLAS
jgi:glycyl-tRNA synthetase beta chain